MPTDRAGFVNNAYNQARAAGLSDTQARLAAAQAANETGYGQHVVGNNFFGIKAGPSWTGSVVNAGTSEEVNGQNQRTNANFRSYASPMDSYSDYAGLLSRNYPDAYNATDFDSAVNGLQTGKYGAYATDSRYGTKLRSIAGLLDPTVTSKPLMAPVNALNVPAMNVTPTINEQQMATPTANVQVSQPTSAAQGGLLSPQEAQAAAAQRSYLASQPFNTNTSAATSQKVQKAVGAVLGGLLGGVTLGPVGGLLGAVVGKQIASPNGLLGNNSFPDKPQSTPRGDGSMTSYGKSVASSSGQFSNAMSKGGIGLY